MTKQELINAMATATGFTVANAEIALNAFIDETTNALSNGGPVDLEGFGVFSVVEEGNGVVENVAYFEPGNDLSRIIK